MVIRTKGRAKFDYDGRRFVWYVEHDVLLRIASFDKQFAVAYEFVGNNPLLAIAGPEFIGVDRDIARPVWIVPPRFSSNLGGKLVREILDWCFDSNHKIEPYTGEPETTVQRVWDSLQDNT